jgi:hypothetical protein
VAVLVTRDQSSTGHLTGTLLGASGAPGRTMAGRFGSSWNTPGWSEPRGAASSMAPAARLFRMGVRFATADAAVSLGDTAATRDALATLREAGGTNSSALPTIMAFEARGMTPSPRALTRLGSRLRESESDTSPLWFDLGAWCGVARLALSAGNADYFAQGGEAMSTLAGLIAGAEQAREAPGREDLLATLRQLASPPDPTMPDLGRVGPIIQAALNAGAR